MMDLIRRLFGRPATTSGKDQMQVTDASVARAVIETSRQPSALPHEIIIRPWEVPAVPGVAEGASGEVEALEPDALAPVAIMAQALDNQWVPRDLLQSMLRNPPADGLQSPAVAESRHRAVRAEYIRALINGQQLVVNRAFMYNTSAVSQDYRPDEYNHRPESAGSFKALLDQGAIVPYLLFEESPADPPGFSFDEVAFREWRRICQEIRTKCVRFSWEPDTNRTLANGLFANYESRIMGINLPLRYGDAERYLADCNITPDGSKAFEQQLIEVRSWVNAQERLSRDGLYQKFVMADGTPTWQGKYDPGNGPFVFALKQLFDLDYAVNLTDALGLYTLTPIDSLARTSLQELTVQARMAQVRGSVLEPDDLTTLVKQFKFDLTQGGLYLEGMGDLALSDVLAIRDTDAWYAYIQSVQTLLGPTLQDPQATIRSGSLQDQMKAVYANYERLMRVMTDYVKRDRAQVAEKTWTPLATLLIDIGGALVTAAIVPPTAGFGAAFVYGVAGNVLQSRAGVVARMLIRGTAALGAQANLEASLDFLRAKLNNATELVKVMGSGSDAEVRIPAFEEAGFKYIKDIGPKLTREFDQTVNFPEDATMDGVATG